LFNLVSTNCTSFQVTLLKKRATHGVTFTPIGWPFGQHTSVGQTRPSKIQPQRNVYRKFEKSQEVIGKLTLLTNPNTVKFTFCHIQSRLIMKAMSPVWINLGIVFLIPVPVFWVARVDICLPS
jgi:hypothetical protein